MIFFVISGFVLTPGFERAPGAVWQQCLKRLIRLVLPAVAALGLAMLAQSLLPVPRTAIVQASGSPFLDRHHFATDSYSHFRDISGLVIVVGYEGMTLLRDVNEWLPKLTGAADPPIWSLHIELFGSAVVLALVWARARGLYPLILALLVALVGGTALLLFIAGHLAALMVRTGWFMELCARPWTPAAAALLLALGLCCGEFGDNVPGLWRWKMIALAASPARPHDLISAPHMAGAILVFIAILASPHAQAALRLRLPLWLGRVSFPVYLRHWPILMVVSGPLFVATESFGQAVAFVTATAAGLAITLGVAPLFERWIDQPAIRLARAIPLGTAPP